MKIIESKELKHNLSIQSIANFISIAGLAIAILFNGLQIRSQNDQAEIQNQTLLATQKIASANYILRIKGTATINLGINGVRYR